MKIRQYAQKLQELENSGLLREQMKSGKSFPAAREDAVSELFGSAEPLRQPNDLLAVEYVRALQALDSKIKPFSVLRAGTQHDEDGFFGNIASASYIRKQLTDGKYKNAMEFVSPKAAELYAAEIEAGRAPFNFPLFDSIELAGLRRLEKSGFAEIEDVGEGLENRIYNAVRTAADMRELCGFIKTKRYTMSRIRRVLLTAFLGTAGPYRRTLPPYIRVLGFNERGLEMLKEAKNVSKLPVVTRYSQISELNSEARAIFEAQCRAADLYSFCLPKPQPCGTEQSFGVIKCHSRPSALNMERAL